MLERIEIAPTDGFGIALAIVIPDGKRKKKVVGFCYARRLWLNHICLEFLAATAKGVGSLLLYSLAEIAQNIEAGEIWGECTQASQGFYRKVKAQFLAAHLDEVMSNPSAPASYIANAQLPGSLMDRFVFGKTEIAVMASLLEVYRIGAAIDDRGN